MPASKAALVSLLLMFLLLWKSCGAEKNACGGTRILAAIPGDTCTPGQLECKAGVLVCANENSVVCVCINQRYATSKQNRSCTDWDCGKNGVCVGETSPSCHCYPGYSGNRCESFTDPCAISGGLCGDRGKCVNSSKGKWACKCDEGFGGRHCDTQTRCQPNGAWKNGACKCKEGYSGTMCDSCDKDGICLPTMDPSVPFSLAFASLQHRQEMTDDLLPPNMARRYFAKHPIIPNSEYDGVLYDCACQAVQHKGFEPETTESFLFIDNEYWGPYDFRRPSSHHYREDFDEHYRYNYYDLCYQNGIAVVITFVVILLTVWTVFPQQKPPVEQKPVVTPSVPPEDNTFMRQPHAHLQEFKFSSL